MCKTTTSWEVFAEFTNIYDRLPSPTNVTHGTIHFIGLFDSVDACFAAVNASKAGPFHSFTYLFWERLGNFGMHATRFTHFCSSSCEVSCRDASGKYGVVAGCVSY